jgi:hypothetical protein
VPLYTPEQAARSTLAALRWRTRLPRTVRLDFSNEFVAGRGQTVNVLAPITAGDARTYTAANRAARDAIVFNELDQTWFPVTLEDQVYNAVRLPDDFATFTLQDLERQVLRPQAESVVKAISAPLITEMSAIATNPTIPAVTEGDETTPSNFRRALIKARQILATREVDLDSGNLWVAVGANMEAAALSDPLLNKANESGTSETLRRASLGNLYGFEVIADYSLDPDYGIAYHSDAFALVTRPSRQPEGAAKSATVAQDGFALRWIQHYNPLQLEDQSVVDTFVGATTLDADRAVSLAMATGA